MKYQYGVKRINDDEMIMSLPTDDMGAVVYAEDLLSGDGFGKNYSLVRREVGEWETVGSLSDIKE